MAGITSHYGLNHFVISYKTELDDAGPFASLGGEQCRANQLWDFFRDRLNNGNEPFYFYLPSEQLEIDEDGEETTGRYLVRLENPNDVLNREYFMHRVFSYAGIGLVEVRE